VIIAGFRSEADARRAGESLSDFCEVVGPRWTGEGDLPWTLLVKLPDTSLSQLYLNASTLDMAVDAIERHDGRVLRS
jgi:hypothetical protein